MLLALVPAAGATPVSVRIVGDRAGLDTTAVNTSGQAVPGGCAGHSAGEALDKAVNGAWDRMAFVSTILGEAHTYVNSDYWSFWINDTYSQVGLCDYTVKTGDRVLIFVQRDNAAFAGTIFPLTLAGIPSTVVAGTPFTVTVAEQRTDGTTTTPVAAAGALVTAGGATALTDVAGKATLTLSSAGRISVRASRTGNVASDAAFVTVSAVPVVAGTPAPTPPPPPPPPAQVPMAAFRAPSAAVVGIAEGQRFARGQGPRELKVKASAGAGLLAVKLRLTRRDGRRCTTFNGTTERFRAMKCGAENGLWFGIGDRSETSYLLPVRLPRGRYVLDVDAIDRASQSDATRRRGGNRIVFYVG